MACEKDENLLLFRPHGVHAVGKLLGLRVVGQLALHPDEVGERRKGDGAVDGALSAALVAVVALAGARAVPVPEDVVAEQVAGDGAHVGVALAADAGDEVGDGLLVLAGGLELVDHGLVEALEPGLGHPLVLNGLQLGAVLALELGGDHEVVQGLQVGVGRADDEGVVARVDGGGDEGRGLGVGSRNGEEISSYMILVQVTV